MFATVWTYFLIAVKWYVVCCTSDCNVWIVFVHLQQYHIHHCIGVLLQQDPSLSPFSVANISCSLGLCGCFICILTSKVLLYFCLDVCQWGCSPTVLSPPRSTDETRRPVFTCEEHRSRLWFTVIQRLYKVSEDYVVNFWIDLSIFLKFWIFTVYYMTTRF